ncbi:MAG: protein-disulfide reductase DsbD family protein [Kiloniellaceae bacterium]
MLGKDQVFKALASLVLAAPLIVAGPGGRALAAAGPWVEHDQARLRLIAGQDAAGEAEALSLGLQFKLRPGWKIYWRSPGDAGYPPSVDWSGSDNLAAASLEWPVPHRFSLFGLETFGYSDEVVLPIEARLERPGEAVLLRGKVDYLICEEICIPQNADLRLALPAGPAATSRHAFLIDSFRTQVPRAGPAGGLSLERAVLTGTVEAPVLQVTARSDIPFTAPDVLVEGPPGFSFAKPDLALGNGGKTAVLRLAATATGEGVLEGKRLRLTVIDGRRGVEHEVIARFAEAAGGVGPPRAAGATLAAILGLALLGGLILNLMPCVLPVLSIKLLSVVKHGGRARGEVRASFLASAAGIVASFLVLATGAAALKMLGMGVGWGIQFQQPMFLTAMAVVVTLFACNLFGFFEISLPGWAQRLAGAGAGAAPGAVGHGLSGHFLTGAFATLLATPCSAPFLGTAVGFALARGPAEIYVIFTVLGLGLALPYLLIAAAPALAGRLPRPGAWMVRLKRVLGLALAGTAAWLLSVLAAQVGPTAALGVGGLLLGLALALWFGRTGARWRLATPVVAGVLALAALALPAGFAAREGTPAGTGPTEAGAGPWRPLDPTRIADLVGDGKLVFVDVTADWCLTCQVNKTLVLDKDTVRARLDDPGVVTMRGDWTLPSEAISRYLESFGRYGIPFNAVYGPGAPEGLTLPELLSVEAVLKALDRAAGG